MLLTKEDVQLQISKIIKKFADRGLNRQVEQDALDFLVQVGFQPEYGARPVKRAITSYLVDDLSINLINGNLSDSKQIVIYANHDSLIFTNLP